MDPSELDIQTLLRAARAGDAEAADRIFDAAYDALHGISNRMFRSQGRNHTLQPTVLVHEAWMRMQRPGVDLGRDPAHFIAIAARAMRQVLVNHARDKAAEKRGGKRRRERLTYISPEAPELGQALDALSVHEAIEQLEALSPRQAQIAEMRLFGGLPHHDIAEVLQVSQRTVELDWRMAREWMAGRLAPGEAD